MKKLIAVLLVCVMCAAFFAGCDKQEKKELYNRIDNVTYGSNPLQKYDVVLPPTESANGGLFLFIHGGGWLGGSRVDIYTQNLMTLYWKDGYTVASMDYEYAGPEVNMDTLLNDVKLALNSIYDQAESKGITLKSALLIGWDAGAHLAELYAYKNANEAKIAVKCVCGYGGIGDLTDPSLYYGNMWNGILGQPLPTILSYLCGKEFTDETYKEAEAELKAISPITYVDTAVPTIIGHGTEDVYVPFSNSSAFQKALEEAKVPSKLIKFYHCDSTLLNDQESLVYSHQLWKEYAKQYF